MEHLSKVEQEGGNNQSPSFTKEKLNFNVNNTFLLIT